LTYLFSILIFVFILLLIMLAANILNEKAASVKSRLKNIEETQLAGDDVQPLNQPFKLRIIKPLEIKAVNYFNSLLPANLKEKVDKKLIICGNPRGIKAGVFLSGVIVVGIAAIVLWFFGSLFLGNSVINTVKGMFFILLLALIIPSLWLQMTAAKRIKDIELSLPDVIDLLVVSVEAGLGFDMALTKVTEKLKSSSGH
jgi:tight adherence protein C